MESIIINPTRIEIASFEDTYDIICPKDTAPEDFEKLIQQVISTAQSSNQTFHLLIKAGFEFSRTTPFEVKHTTFIPREDTRVTIVTIPLRHIEIDIEIAGQLLTLKVNEYTIEAVDRIYEALGNSSILDLSLEEITTQYKAALFNEGISCEAIFEEG